MILGVQRNMILGIQRYRIQGIHIRLENIGGTGVERLPENMSRDTEG